MTDLELDTAVTPTGEGTYSALASRDWEIWGPQGGYLASFALRAAGVHSGAARPASIVGHFLGVASFDAPITITCTTLRTAKTAQSVRASITQGDRAIFEALVWGVAQDLVGLDHHDAPAPPVEHWSALPTMEERCAAQGETAVAPFRFWDNFEQRPPEWDPNWNERATGARPPRWQQWLRYRAHARFDDPWVDACRALVLVDVGSWPAAQAFHNTGTVMAPSIDLACEFHALDRATDWLLVEGHAPTAVDGLVASHQQVWSDDGVLIASGVSQLLCRPVRPR